MARALLQNPQLLILDEPLAAIDTKGRGQLMDLMEQLRQLKQREPEPVVPTVNRTRYRTDEAPPFSVN